MVFHCLNAAVRLLATFKLRSGIACVSAARKIESIKVDRSVHPLGWIRHRAMPSLQSSSSYPMMLPTYAGVPKKKWDLDVIRVNHIGDFSPEQSVEHLMSDNLHSAMLLL